VVNKTTKKLRLSILGWLENGVNKRSSNPQPGNHGTDQRGEALGQGTLRNSATSLSGNCALLYSCDDADEALRSATDAGSMFLMAHTRGAEPLARVDLWPVSDGLFDLQPMETAEAETPAVLVGGIRTGGMVEAAGTL